MKRKISTIFSLTLAALCACLALTSCTLSLPEPKPEGTACTTHVDNDGDGVCDTEGCDEAVTPSPTPDTGCFNENGELLLYKGGTPTFQFVLGSDVAAAASDIDELIATLNELSASDVKSVTYADPETEVEILVGTITNRGEEYAFDKYDLGESGYIVKRIGTRIVVLGGGATGLANAVRHLKEEVFGIRKTNAPFGDYAMAESANFEYIQSNYAVSAVNLAGKPIEEYVVTYDGASVNAKGVAEAFQRRLYLDTGLRVEVYREDRYHGEASQIKITCEPNDGEGNGFDVYFEEDCLVLKCEYDGLYPSIAEELFDTLIFSKKNTVDIPADYEYTRNYRDVYYSDFGAKGDGTTDDFFAIKEAHEYANRYLMRVHADPEATYYIGSANGGFTINVKTDTYWHGCSFIFDDRYVEYDTAGRTTSIFSISPDTSGRFYSSTAAPIASLSKGQTNIGWAPGSEVMIMLYNSNVSHYIRYGLNENNGNSQRELILVDAEGNVDPMTPIQWDYDDITSMYVYYVSGDRPIEIRGEGEDGRLTTVTTHYNRGPSEYYYYSRNISITRSNVTLSGVEHIIDEIIPQSEGGHGSPYNGFTQVQNANNVVIENMIFQNPEVYYVVDEDGNVTKNNMGSYEMSASNSNNVTWRDCTQSNFFQPDGSVKFQGHMGTNYCKNLTFDNMLSCSFDAHCGVYNATIKNSTCEHLNFIGDGLITYENVTVYVDATRCAFKLRDDYGSTWAGDIVVDGLTLKYASTLSKSAKIYLIGGSWTNWDFGYVTYTPQNITLRNVMTEEYSYEMVDGVRIETHVSYNGRSITLFSSSFEKVLYDVSDPNASILGKENLNPMVGTKTVTLYTEYTDEYAELGITKAVDFDWPYTKMFKDLTVTVDGVSYSFGNYP